MDLPESIALKSKLPIWDQRIEYESIPFTCFHCKKAGHWQKQCPSLKGKAKKIAKKSKKIWVEKDQSKDVLVAAKGPAPPQDQTQKDSWLVSRMDGAPHLDLPALKDVAKEARQIIDLTEIDGENTGKVIPLKELNKDSPLMVNDGTFPT